MIYYIDLTEELPTLASEIQEKRRSCDDGKRSFKNVTRIGGNSKFEIILLKAVLFIFAMSIKM